MGKEVQAILNLLSEGVIVEGDIQTPRDIRIDGTLVGTVHTDGRLVLGPSSRVTGKVNSPNIDSVRERGGGYSFNRYCRVKGKIKREGNDLCGNHGC